MLVPDRWDDLAAGIADGLSAMPGIVVPYSGENDWVRITLLLGATLLSVLGALQSFWPRPGRRDCRVRRCSGRSASASCTPSR